MSIVHFLNVLEGDCNIIQHDSGRISVIDVSNADNDIDTPEEARKKASLQRLLMQNRTNVPSGKIDYKQKLYPDNPIDYLRNNIGTMDVFRFIITHPDMDHIDGIKDLYSQFEIVNTWDTDNNKACDLNSTFGGYSKDDWIFYKNLRDGKSGINRRTYFNTSNFSYFTEDDIKILCPTPELVRKANESSSNYHDLSYVLLFTPPRQNGGRWKILFAGDSHDNSWDYILTNYPKTVSNIDILFAPHHGRGSDRSFDFLNTLKPRVTLLGNASSEYLAYSNYPKTRITNNQAGYVVMEITPEKIVFYIKNKEFAEYYKSKRKWSKPSYDYRFKAYDIFQIN